MSRPLIPIMICALAIVLALVGWGLYLGATVELTNTKASNSKATACAVLSTQKAANDIELTSILTIHDKIQSELSIKSTEAVLRQNTISTLTAENEKLKKQNTELQSKLKDQIR